MIMNGNPSVPERFIPVAAPAFVGNERDYVLDCIDSGWVSSIGKYVEQFESGFAAFCGTRAAIGCSSGTAALHLALVALGVGPGDEVLVPSLTFVAVANAVTYCGARPVFIDSEPERWNLNADLLEDRITARTKAVIPVHLYGYPAELDKITTIARERTLFVVEDSAEALGAEIDDRRTGSIGDIGVFSLYGNKVLTTGEGGMVVTDDLQLAEQIRLFRGQGMDLSRRYWFPVVGYNYRMTNVAAAIGMAQLEMVEWHMSRREEITGWYRERLANESAITWQTESPNSKARCWMFTVIIDPALGLNRDEIIGRMSEKGIETRPVFHPMHVLPPYKELARVDDFPVADYVSRHGLSLPTWAGLTRSDVDHVCDKLLAVIGREP